MSFDLEMLCRKSGVFSKNTYVATDFIFKWP